MDYEPAKSCSRNPSKKCTHYQKCTHYFDYMDPLEKSYIR